MVLATTAWRAERNAKARARLLRHLPDIFPATVLAHALRKPFVPPTPRRAIESYWRHHPVRADKLARALAARSGVPAGWTWRLAGAAKAGGKQGPGLPGSFRAPPAPYREAAHAKGPGHCCVCGQPVFRLGWHRDLWDDRRPNKNASWHSCCVAAWNLWTAPSDHLRHLKALQGRLTGGRLLKDAEVDHRVPLFQVWRDHGGEPWPRLLAFWGVPNLQIVNRSAHVEKCAQESGERAQRRGAPQPEDANALVRARDEEVPAAEL